MSLLLYITATIAIQSIFILGSAANVDSTYIEDFVPNNYVDEYLDGRNKRAVVFSGVQPEGVAVLNRLDNIMKNTSISAESKRKLEEALSNIGKDQTTGTGGQARRPASSGGGAGGGGGGGFRPSFSIRGRWVRPQLSTRRWVRPQPSLPRTTPRPQLHATECCCKVNVPPLTSRKSRATTQWKALYRRIRTGSRKCGFWGWRRCTQWGTQKYYVSYQQTYYYTVSTPRSCPKDKEVCCRGFVAYKRCCTNIKEMIRLLDLFENQRDQYEDLRAFLIAQGHKPDAGCPKSCGP